MLELISLRTVSCSGFGRFGLGVPGRHFNLRRHRGREVVTCSLKKGGQKDNTVTTDGKRKDQNGAPIAVGTDDQHKDSAGRQPSRLVDSKLKWNDIDSDAKTNFLKQAFEKDFLRKSSVYRDPSQQDAPERLTDFLSESDTRDRFIKRCLVPTAVAFSLGCLAYVLQELGFSGLSVLGHNLVAGLLGFLMAFVTSTNYNRWLQARASLCNITILCVDIASRADVFLTNRDEDGIRARREMARYLRLLYTTLILTVTDGPLWGGTSDDHANCEVTSKELRRMMMEDASPSERRVLLGGGPRDLPFLVVDLIRIHINKDSTLKSFAHSNFGSQFIAINCQDSLRNKVDELFPSIGNCLALALTPLPLGYRTIFSTLLSVLVYTFPFALVSEITWETPIVSAFLAFGYYGVYSMSQELIFPFRPRATSKDNTNLGLFSCNADWVRVMSKEFNRILIKT